MIKNYCTFAPDGLFGYYWGDKCKIHDEDYYYQKCTRKEADIKLRDGMKEVLPNCLHWIAWIYYLVVRKVSWLFW